MIECVDCGVIHAKFYTLDGRVSFVCLRGNSLTVTSHALESSKESSLNSKDVTCTVVRDVSAIIGAFIKINMVKPTRGRTRRRVQRLRE